MCRREMDLLEKEYGTKKVWSVKKRVKRQDKMNVSVIERRRKKVKCQKETDVSKKSEVLEREWSARMKDVDVPERLKYLREWSIRKRLKCYKEAERSKRNWKVLSTTRQFPFVEVSNLSDRFRFLKEVIKHEYLICCKIKKNQFEYEMFYWNVTLMNFYRKCRCEVDLLIK